MLFIFINFNLTTHSITVKYKKVLRTFIETTYGVNYLPFLVNKDCTVLELLFLALLSISFVPGL